MKKGLIIGVVGCLLFTGCGSKQKKQETAEKKQVSEWSCTHQQNLDLIQRFLKDEYLKNVDKSLRESNYYQADQDLLQKINQGLTFKINQVRTLTTEPSETTKLECEGQIVIQFPKGLQKRAENAYLEHGAVECDYEECESDSGYSTLRDYIEDSSSGLVLDNDQLKGQFNYNILKTDQDGFSLNVNNQNEVIRGVVTIAVKAVQYAAYIKENKEISERHVEQEKEQSSQKELAQKAMDIRKKELDDEKNKQVERLNQTWDRFTDEQKAKLKQDQTDWFEKRDIDCKVISQRSIHDIPDSELEIYQKQSDYWDNTMRAENREMEYSKCFSKRTQERIVYLNNVFN